PTREDSAGSKASIRERIAGTHARRLCTARRALHPPVLPLPASYAMMAGAAYTLVLFLSMVLTPRLRAVQQLMTSLWVFAPVALIYLGLLAYSWTPDTLSILFPGSLQEGLSGGFKPQFFPRLPAIAQLFSQPATAASLVGHVLSINLFLGRQIYLEAPLPQTTPIKQSGQGTAHGRAWQRSGRRFEIPDTHPGQPAACLAAGAPRPLSPLGHQGGYAAPSLT
ncbi:hypothetical protein QJQ45_017216, partial [Haematococcus lacustris]